MANEFLVSVADAIIRDATTGEALALGTANLSSAFTMSMQATQVRGGRNNPLLYSFMHDKELKVEIKQATFGKTILALNAGTLVSNGSVNVTKTDCITLANGVGTVSETPVGNVSVFLPNGTVQTVTPSTKTITVSGGVNQKITAVYVYADTTDRISIETTTPPSVVDLTLIAEVRSNSGVITEYLQINVPKFQVDGNYVLNLAANGVSEESLTGFALSVSGTSCTTGDIYATVDWIPASASNVAVSGIAALPSTMTFSAAAGNASQNITLYGIRGGMYANSNITTSGSYAKDGGGSAHIAVGAYTGVVSTTSGSAGDVATITVSYDNGTATLTDTVDVTVTA